MNRVSNRRLKAFTILELTVVLAVLSVLVTIIAVALNRFNEQLKNSSEIHAELNEWFAFRSNLWSELYHADSVVCKKSEVSIFKSRQEIAYRAEDEMLERKTNGDWTSTGIFIENIEDEPAEDGGTITFNFMWKNEIMKLSYQKIPKAKDIIDRYFEETDE